jgi:hypothetical protein
LYKSYSQPLHDRCLERMRHKLQGRPRQNRNDTKMTPPWNPTVIERSTPLVCQRIYSPGHFPFVSLFISFIYTPNLSHIQLLYTHCLKMAQPQLPQFFGLIPTGHAPILTPTSAPSPTSLVYTIPVVQSRPFSHIVVFLVPGEYIARLRNRSCANSL